MDKVYVLSFCDTWSEVYGVFTSWEEAKEAMFEIMESNDETIDREDNHYRNGIQKCYWVSDKDYYLIEECELNILR